MLAFAGCQPTQTGTTVTATVQTASMPSRPTAKKHVVEVQDPQIREIARALNRVVDPSQQRTPAELVKDLGSSNVEIRRKAALDIIDLDPDYVTEDFDKLGLALTKALTDRDEEVADNAAVGFARLRSPSVIYEELPALLHHKDKRVTDRATLALWLNGADAFSEEAQQVIENAAAPEGHRVNAIMAMAGSYAGSGYWKTRMLDLLNDESPKMQSAAIHYFGRTQTEEVMPIFGDLIKSPDLEIRLAVVRGLRWLHSPVAVQLLKQLENDPNPTVSRDAIQLLYARSKVSNRTGSWHGKSLPKFVDTRIGDFDLWGSQLHIWDKRAGQFLIADGECDGAHKWLIWTSDPARVSDGIHDSMVLTLPELKTGKGLALGDSQALVRSKLGKPQKSRTVKGSQVDVYSVRRGAHRYSAEYHYKDAVLVAISFRDDDLESAC